MMLVFYKPRSPVVVAAKDANVRQMQHVHVLFEPHQHYLGQYANNANAIVSA